MTAAASAVTTWAPRMRGPRRDPRIGCAEPPPTGWSRRSPSCGSPFRCPGSRHAVVLTRSRPDRPPPPAGPGVRAQAGSGDRRWTAPRSGSRSRRARRGSAPRAGGCASTICTATTVLGPPLCSCPVECRKRGPYPAVTAMPAEVVAHPAPQRLQGGVLAEGHVRLQRDVVAGLRPSGRATPAPRPASPPRPGARGRAPSTSLVFFFDSATLGSSKGSMPEHVPAHGDWPPPSGRTARPRSSGRLEVRRAPGGGRRPPRARWSARARSPVPRLPVDSAMSCSTHRPNDGELRSGRPIVTLSRPARASSPMAMPKPTASLEVGVERPPAQSSATS